MCSFFTTKISNNKGINKAERLAACCHNDMATNVKYQERGIESEANCICCVLDVSNETNPPPSKKPKLLAPSPDTSCKSTSVTSSSRVSMSIPDSAIFTPPVVHKQPSPTVLSKTPTKICFSTEFSPDHPVKPPTSFGTTTLTSTSTIKHSPEDRVYSVHTQMEVDALYKELEAFDRKNKVCQQRRHSEHQPSQRQLEYRRLRNRIHSLEKEQRRISSPYQSDAHEAHELYLQSLEHDEDVSLERMSQRDWEEFHEWQRYKDMMSRKGRRSY